MLSTQMLLRIPKNSYSIDSVDLRWKLHFTRVGNTEDVCSLPLGKYVALRCNGLGQESASFHVDNLCFVGKHVSLRYTIDDKIDLN